MASLTVTNFDKALKVYYTPQRVKCLAYKNNPLLGLMPKMEEFKGKHLPIAIWHRVGQGVSATFATAQTNKGVGGYANFDLTRVRGYGLGSLENEVLEASRGDKAAFLEATVEIDGVTDQVSRDIAIAQYRDQTGSRGIVSSYTTGTDTLVLTNREDIKNFEVDMKVVFADPAAPTTLRNSGTAVTVLTINRSAGSMTLSADPTSIAANDLIMREGDVTASSAALKMAGLSSWIPASAPGATAFFGVDRSVDTDRLGGLRITGTGGTLQDALTLTAARLGEVGARPSHAFVSPMQFHRLIQEMDAKVQHDIVKSPDVASIGFEAIKLYTPAGVVRVVADPNCQPDVLWMLQMDTWKFYTLGGAPKMLTYAPGEGNRWLREASADAVEFRAGWYGNIGCNAPGFNARCSLDAV